MRTIHIMSGLPASGKSTYCENAGGTRGDLVIHRDDIRAELRKALGSKEVFPCSAKEEYDYFIQYLATAINGSDKDVWIDQTTLSAGSAVKLIKSLGKFIDWSDFKITFEVIHTPLDICIARDAVRSGFEHVTEEVIRNMNKGFNITLDEVLNHLSENFVAQIDMAHHYNKEEKYE